MKTINLSDFEANLDSYFEFVEKTQNPVLIQRKSGKEMVLISAAEYESLIETLHLLGSKKNAERIYQSIQQMNIGKTN